MADSIILADTSILIDYFRKSNKENSVFLNLFDRGYKFSISVITHFEIYSGVTLQQTPFWVEFLTNIKVLPFDETISELAASLDLKLKRKRRQIGMADLFIAATAINSNLALSTLNKKHFERINEVNLID